MKRAEAQEHKGHYSAAVVRYQQIFDHTPQSNRRLRSQILVHMGECLFQMERYSDAFTAFQKATEEDSSNSLAHLKMGELLLAAGAPERARQQAQIVLDRGLGDKDHSNDAQILMAAALADSGKADLAKQIYSKILSSDPKRISVAIALADLYNADDQLDQAREVLHQAAKAQPQSALPWLALGRLSEQEGDGVQGEVAYRKAVQLEDTPETNLRLAQFLQRAARVNEAEQVLRKVDAERRSAPTALPDFEMISGHPKDALDQLSSVLKTLPLDQPKKSAGRGLLGDTPRRADGDRATIAARLVEAEILSAQKLSGDTRSKAIQLASKHLEDYRATLDPAVVEILASEIALENSDLPAARQHSKRAVDLAPSSAPAHFISGNVQQQVGDFAAARTEWTAAVQADSHFTPARLALAEDALGSGDLDSADTQSRAVVRDEPGNLRGLVLFGRTLLAQKRYDSAAVIGRRAASLDPSSPDPSLLLGDVALRQSQLPLALVEFQKAVVLDPNSPEAITGLLNVYRKGDVTRPMLLRMEKVAAAQPPSATLMEITGRLFAERGWYDDARRCLQHTLQIQPNRSTAASALAELHLAAGQVNAAADSAAQAGGVSAQVISAYRSQQNGQIAAAIAQYETAMRAGENTGVAANNLAWILAEQGGDLDRALALSQIASKDSPNDPAVLDTVGFVHLRRREYTEAVNVLETANRLAHLQQSSDSAELLSSIRQHLAEAYAKTGQTDAADEIAQKRGWLR